MKTPNTKPQTPRVNRTTGGVSNGIRMTCGVKEVRPHFERPLRTQAADKWERRAGEDEPIVGASLVELERRLAAL